MRATCVGVDTTFVVSFEVVTRLSRSDLEETLAFVQAAAGVTGPEAFPSELLDRLMQLLPCDWLDYIEQDLSARQELFARSCACRPEYTAEMDETFWALRHQHPICTYLERSGESDPRKISDFLSQRALRRLEIYADHFRPQGLEYELYVGLPSPPCHQIGFVFSRQRHDFGERDRRILELLRPHLVRLDHAARGRRLASALALNEAAAGLVVVVHPSGCIDYAAPAAGELLDQYFGGSGNGRLPVPVESWLRDESRKGNEPKPALTAERDGRRLTVHRVGSSLILRDEVAALTTREREILNHVARGRSNAEIAAELRIAPTTVRTHLENIYAKLGVHTRTAAIARARTH
jgi:DNA-binding CsgD family transcriptional regulator